MVDMKGWRNPYLIIRADGVALLDPDNHLERILKPGELTQALGNLPPAAWPYGRVVAVTENGVRGSADDSVKIRQNRALVAGTLESMHVLINWIPSVLKTAWPSRHENLPHHRRNARRPPRRAGRGQDCRTGAHHGSAARRPSLSGPHGQEPSVIG